MSADDRVTTIELVRHAHAHPRDRWQDRPDHERPLSERGHQQAQRLVADLGWGADVAGLYSSPTTRCVQTLEPLAQSLGLPIQPAPAIAEAHSLPVTDGGHAWVAAAWQGGQALAFVEQVLGQHPGGRVVACSHGDVIPALMALLVGRDGLGVTDASCPKGGRFTLGFQGTRCVSAVLVPNGEGR